jgi:DNA-binding LytR/AlgR family response regulator
MEREMKIRIEIDDTVTEDEVVIRCSAFSEEIQQLQKLLSEASGKNERFEFYKDEKQFYFPLDQILFFETDGTGVRAHTANDIFTVRYKLYELEQILPRYFARVSKSSILNTKRIYSITKNISSSSMVEFYNSHKQVYVSRYYYKMLMDMLKQERK